MANCCACGGKVAGFGADKYTFSDNHILCYKCAPAFKGMKSATTYEDYVGMKKALERRLSEAPESYYMLDREFVRSEIAKLDSEKSDMLEAGKRRSELLQRQEKERQQNLIRQQEWMKKRKAEFLLTTGYNFDGYRIDKYIDIVQGEVVLGTGFMSELSAQLNDLAGTTSGTLEGKLSKAKKIAQERLVNNCLNEGANAVIGIDFDITTLHNNMIVVSANGTAVFIEKE